jgi:hypothetical protein
MFDVHFLANSRCETAPKWHGFLMIKPAAFQASGAASMKLHQVKVSFWINPVVFLAGGWAYVKPFASRNKNEIKI